MTGSKGLQEPRTGRNAGCYWTSPTPVDAGVHTRNLGERGKEMNCHTIHLFVAFLNVTILKQTSCCLLLSEGKKKSVVQSISDRDVRVAVQLVYESLKHHDYIMSGALSSFSTINKSNAVYT